MTTQVSRKTLFAFLSPAVFALLTGLVALTVFAGPVTAWLDATAAGLHDPTAYVVAVLPRAGE